MPANNDWKDVGHLPTDFSAWTTSDMEKAYGMINPKWLGLARPELAKNNAENYAVFSLCVKYPTLDCVGGFTYAIARRQSVPFVVSPRVAKKLRTAVTGFDGRLNESALYAEDIAEGESFMSFPP